MQNEKIHTYAIEYAFNQPLAAPANVAFEWCTDYQPYDLAIMKEKGKRGIQKITGGTILLTETTRRRNRVIKKTKLVRLNRSSLSWTNTHLAGPNRYSQFLYKIVAEGRRRSRLYFQGLLIEYSRRPLSRQQIRKIARDERLGDVTVWRHLAAALRKDTALR
jgi:hypothetical protein